MNKRIKKKVSKRILNKIKTKESLTDFEKKYFINFIWKPLKKSVKEIVEGISAATSTEEEKEELLGLDHIREKTVMIDATQTEEAMQKSADAVGNFGSRITNSSVIAAVGEPSKWQKVKSKVKGWFGK